MKLLGFLLVVAVLVAIAEVRSRPRYKISDVVLPANYDVLVTGGDGGCADA